MFQGFSSETGAFLWDLSFHNERPWFLANKERFERCVNEPFRALAAETTALMQQRCPGRAWSSHCSRIYRDARRLFGRGPYKDHLWFILMGDEGAKRDGPAFWFELAPGTWEYGVGYFDAPPAVMEAFRKSIDANPARFERIAGELAHMRGLRVLGPEYKRPKGCYEGVLGAWYNRRWLAIEWKKDHGEALYDPALPQTLVRAYQRLLPFYEYLLEVYYAATPEEER